MDKDSNKIHDFIKSMEKKNFPFKPDTDFYNKVGIKRKRWAMILRSEVSPTVKEVNAIAKYFNVQITELIEIEK
ncbi:MAG: hypothetical protein CVU05_02730 [Bacteroidetes bacterium HGW-Bacteroidetes-21]|jgi:hypothetical protein|nr:MAG: hypothetical protein CVU05_02730 [Bacteroidetes bacterium HGW-Bacteroidetes-21]